MLCENITLFWSSGPDCLCFSEYVYAQTLPPELSALLFVKPVLYNGSGTGMQIIALVNFFCNWYTPSYDGIGNFNFQNICGARYVLIINLIYIHISSKIITLQTLKEKIHHGAVQTVLTKSWKFDHGAIHTILTKNRSCTYHINQKTGPSIKSN